MEYQARLKFSVYLRREEKLRELYRINRTPTGLYFDEVYNPVKSSLKSRGAKLAPGASASYHADGRYWDKFMGRRDRKIRDIPLSDFSGARSYSTQTCILNDMSLERPSGSVALRDEDIVFERDGPFGIEILLTDKVFELPPLPDRPNSTTYVKEQVYPAIMIEVFDLASPVFPQSRFRRAEPLIEGENLFLDYPDHI